jgi:hypothetical protein
MAKMPAQQHQRRHPNDGNASATRVAVQVNDSEGIIATMATTSVQQQYRRQCNNIDSAIATMVTTPVQQWQ